MLANSTCCFGQKSFTLYGQKVTAAEVLGTTNAEFGPAIIPGEGNYTEVIAKKSEPLAAVQKYQYLGAIYSKRAMDSPADFLNKSMQGDGIVADSINCVFYADYGLSRLETVGKSTALQGFDAFKSTFTQTKKTSARMVLLASNRGIWKALDTTRFVTKTRANEISAKTTLERAFKAALNANGEVSSNIITALKQQFPNAKFSAKLNAAIKSTLNKSVTLSHGAYYEIYLDDDYVVVADRILARYESKPTDIPAEGAFNAKLKIFLGDTDQAILAAAAVIEATIESKTSKSLATDIETTIKANMTASTPVAPATLEATIESALNTKRSQEFNVSPGHRFYYIRLGYLYALEKGAGGQNDGSK